MGTFEPITEGMRFLAHSVSPIVAAESQPPAKGLEARWKTPGGISVTLRAAAALAGPATGDAAGIRLHLEHARLGLLRGFDQLLCLEGVTGVEHFPHQIETVRMVLRHFRGRVLLADEVGLGKTIEACLLLREYLLRGLVKRVLIIVPTPLVSPVAGGVARQVRPGIRHPAQDARSRRP